jgi:hypothetical protein
MSRLPRVLLLVFLVLAAGLIYFTSYAEEKSPKSDFEMTASYIEACSCDMFCPCYFNTHSTNHMDEHHMDAHFCRANLVLKVDKGHYKETKLDGAKVWMVVNFDPSVSKEQRAAMVDILGQLYPIPWQKKGMDTAAFSWDVDTKTGVAHAKMESGKGEVVLERVSGDQPGHEVVMQNLKYWGAQSNDGFRMWKTKHEAFEGDGHKFAYDGTNGFLITIHYSGMAKAAAAD